jgi:hypothetical protein
MGGIYITLNRVPILVEVIDVHLIDPHIPSPFDIDLDRIADHDAFCRIGPTAG